MSKEQKTIDTETINVASYESIIKDTKVAIKDKTAEIDAAVAAGNDALAKQLDGEKNALLVSLSDTEQKKDASLTALDKAQNEFTQLQDSYATVKNAITKAQDQNNDIKQALNKYTSDFNEYSNSTILKQFEEETKVRKNLTSRTLANKERIMPLLKNANTGLDDKMQEFTSDTGVFINDVKEELGVDEGAVEIIKQSIAELNKDYENKGTEGVFTASKALELSRKSLFDLELAGINKLIKAACYKGETSIEILETEITGTQILALNEGGYKVTHKKFNVDREDSDELIVIDWGFVAAPN
jgi:predicted  nucleic acid-binding Zn-ribbon protein